MMRCLPISIILGMAFLVPQAADAQAYRCSIPANPPRPRPDLPTESQPRRLLPIGGYTLSISWSPQYCRDNGRRSTAKFQCRDNKFGFVLHGLWPDGVGKTWPQYCRPAAILPADVVRTNLCKTPSPQLLQHEWAKHGTCMSDGPQAYFAQSATSFSALRYPDMDALSRGPLTAGKLAAAVAASNPGMDADMMRITANRKGWLDEIWFCLDKQFQHARCPAQQGGLAAGASLKIWRGRP